ncbi:ATP-binding cassette domain-containing protein [Glaciibacter superstes]|uniref:ATP-binding cassette domain-containing protein n=1 Tax=Glaciibacter superstes TaxID=501023 RepID=UPI0003B437B6|nr:ATP-binding cassette domain-containing protein [Glaciibacter superstes]
MSSKKPLLQARSITRSFGQVQALRGASFDVYEGEIVALIGDNGAGKSTLVKCLSGADRPDGGEVLLEGKPVSITSPTHAQSLGIETVYQDLSLAPDLDPAANLFLGRELLKPGLGWLGVLDNSRMQSEARAAFRELGTELLSFTAPVASLSGGQKQNVAVARSIAWASKVVFMDEPTAALGVVQREKVLDVIRRVRDKGISVVLISHNMPEVIAVADRVEVLRLGQRVARFEAQQSTVEDLVAAMTGALIQEDVA